MTEIPEVQGLVEHAELEAQGVAICLWNHRQKHDDCLVCSTRGFCNLLMKQLREWEEAEIVDRDT